MIIVDVSFPATSLFNQISYKIYHFKQLTNNVFLHTAHPLLELSVTLLKEEMQIKPKLSMFCALSKNDLHHFEK